MSTPDPNRFDWALVRSFLAVLDAGSLMGAARRLNAQQPTLSRQVAQLEAQVKALKDKAAQRRSMALQAARRAEREATKLYDAAIIAKVKPAEQPSEQPANGAKSATPS